MLVSEFEFEFREIHRVTQEDAVDYLIFILPGILLSLWAQMKIKSAYAQGLQRRASSGITGAETAQVILDSAGVRGVAIEPVHGHLSDHYDPKAKVLRLSEDVYSGRSLASLGIAAHEVGHAIQDAKRYPFLVVRNGVVPLASHGGRFGVILLFLGLALQSMGLVLLGIGLFSMVVLFQLINLPVEYDASSRAKALLIERGLISNDELTVVNKVLSAAALTYVAATLSSILTLLYYLAQAGLLGSRREE
jgi:uncharacterized protein